MNKYFFYTDPTKVEAQNSGQEFGPAGTAGGKDKYRITNLHTIKTGDNALAIVVCDGMICIQEDDSGTYSIILMPNYQPPFDFPFIKYFIYKGIKRESLVKTGTTEIADGASIPFLKTIRDDIEHWTDPDNDITKSDEILGLKYTSPFPYVINNNSNDLFADDQPLDNFFYYPSPDFQLPTVKAGEKIGEFDTEFGFEIVLERLGYEPQIKLARTKVNYIEVDAIDNPLNEARHSSGKTWAVDDADYFLHWHEKEQCLNYIDPCAFYGSFCGTKVFYFDPSKTSKRTKCNSPEEIYNDILDKIGFWNKNKIYLDIRNDYGYSLNYYKDYGESIAFFNKDDNEQNVSFKTTKGKWSISCFEISMVNIAGNIKRKKFFNTQLALPNNNNNVPLVYLSKAYVKNFRRLRRKHRVQTPSKTLSTDFLEPIELTFITVKDGTDKFISNYYKLNLYDKNRTASNATINPPLTPSKEYYLNGLFRPLDLKQNSIIRDDSFRYTIWHEELLVDQTEYGGPQFIAQVGIAEDEHHITLFAFPYYFVHGGFTNVTPDAFTTFATQSKESNKMFLQEIFDLFTNKELRKQEIKNTELDNTLTELDTVVVQHSPFHFLENAFRARENPEDYVFIMFDKVEYKTILTSLINHTGLPRDLPIFLQKDTIVQEVDDKNMSYAKIAIEASRLNNTSAILQKETIEINKNIFEYANI